MSQPYVGEIRMFGGSFAPAGWAFCAGQLMPISENDTLFNLIGTTYGGDGQETFGIPNLQGRVPMHAGTLSGTTYQIGEMAGVETVTITTGTMAGHGHLLNTSAAAGTNNVPSANVILADAGPSGISTINAYKPFDGSAQQTISPQSVQGAGGSQPHENMQPYLVISYIISLFGIFPSQT